jgi:hypothetical protein
MTTKVGPLRRIQLRAQAMSPVAVDMPMKTGALTLRTLLQQVDARKTRPRLAQLGVPLAIVAAAVLACWWALIPLAACAWYWAPRDWGWEWVAAVGRGLIGAEWAVVGSYALVAFPHERAVVAISWVFAAALIALCSKLVRS